MFFFEGLPLVYSQKRMCLKMIDDWEKIVKYFNKTVYLEFCVQTYLCYFNNGHFFLSSEISVKIF